MEIKFICKSQVIYVSRYTSNLEIVNEVRYKSEFERFECNEIYPKYSIGNLTIYHPHKSDFIIGKVYKMCIEESQTDGGWTLTEAKNEANS